MGLTRPTLTQFNTTSIELSDPLSLLNKGSTAANIDIGFVMNRNGGTQANVAIVWKESANSFVTAFTTGSGASNANITIGEYANLRVNSLTGTISTAAQPNITSLGNLTSLATSGNISTTGYFLGNGSLLSGITASGVSLTSSNVAPMGPSIGALWYDTSSDILFEYINDGISSFWIDITSDPVTTVAGNTNKALYTAKANVTTAITLIDTVTASGNASVSWTLTSKDNTNGRFKSSMINSLNDSANVYYNEFAEIYSDANYQVAVFTSNIVSGNVNLYAVGDSNDVTVSYQRTILGSSTTNTYLLSGAQGTVGPAGNITNPITTAVNITNTSTSTSNITGALTVTGGVGISGNIYQLSGQQLNIGTELTATLLPAGASPMQIVTNTDSNNRVVVQNINTGSNASAGIAFATSTGSATQGFLDVGIMSTGANFGSLRSGDSFIFAQATTAGPGGNLHIGATRNIRMFATNLASPWRDPVQVVEIFSSNLSFAVVSNTTSTSTTTGALTVTGGVGISSNLNVGGNISTTGYFLGNGALLTGIVAGSSYSNVQVAAYLPTYTGNINAGNVSASSFTYANGVSILSDLYSNAAVQSGSLATITANLGSVSGSLTTLTANAASQAGDIATLTANAGVQAGLITTLTANAAAQAGDIATLYANAGVQAGIINNLTGYANTNVSAYLTTYTGAFGNLSSGITSGSTIQTIGIIFANAITTSTSTTTGALVVAGGVGVAGNLNAGSSTIPGIAHIITGNVGVNPTGSAPAARMHVVDDQNQGWRYDQYNSSDGTNFRNYRARGNIVSPSGVLVNDRLGSFLAGGYGVTGGFSGPNGGMSIYAAESFTGSAAGTYLVFGTTTLGNNTGGGGSERLRIDSTGNVGIGNTAPLHKLSVSGNLFVGGFANINLGNVSADSALQIVGNVARGGAGYHDFLRVTSTASGATNISKNLRLDSTGNLQILNSAYSSTILSLTDAGILSDGKGDVRSSPINSQPGSYTAVVADAGKTIVESLSAAAITFNANVFASGDMVSVVNTSAGNITLVQGTNVTLRLAGTATTGTRTLASNGLATVICTVGGATPTFYCSGVGLT